MWRKHMSDQTNGDAEILAIIVSDRESEGIKLVKPEEFSRQLAYTNRSNGHEAQPHLRNPVPRRITPKEVSIIIPALNEEQSIEQVVRGLVTSFPDAEVIVVNDGSTDKTGILASQAGALVITHELPRGYGSALRSGILAATRNFVLFCDADGQHRVEDVARVMAECNNCTMVVGARTKDSYVSRNRRPGKFIIQHWANILARQKIPDINSGLRIIEKCALLKCLHLMPTGFSFSTTSTFA